ncbi:MAG: hypothetical protein LUQ34_03460 [Euryarchaeota archaeon]|nr:hypothetical protein [Euryarchaeota archaeon]
MAIEMIPGILFDPLELIKIIESIDWTQWQTATAQLLGNLLHGLTTPLA